MKRFAFIDVQNTASTAQNLLGFSVDWHRLHAYLKDKWHCEKVYFFSGIDEGDSEMAHEFELLAKSGCDVKTKTVHSYKKPNRTISVRCVDCGKNNIAIVDMGYNRKSNCDVDLTVDAMEMAGQNTDFLIFSGDGDFEYLVRKAVEKGTKIYIVSSNEGVQKSGINTRRYSTKLKILVDKNRGKVHFIEINSWKKIIMKEM